jgi:hypothetical protein
VSAGYPEPPVATRFRKGQSGNPKGRPRSKAPPTASTFDVIFDRTLTLTRNGVPEDVGIEEALQHRTYLAALAGNRTARREVVKMILKREEALEKKKPRYRTTILPSLTEEDPSNADDALLLLGIATLNPDRGPTPDGRHALLLEPWAVTAALKRRRGRKPLTEKDLSEVRRCTRAPDTIPWPRAADDA